MSKALKAVAVLAGAVALAASGIGAFAAPALAATAFKVAAIAGIVSTVPAQPQTLLSKGVPP